MLGLASGTGITLIQASYQRANRKERRSPVMPRQEAKQQLANSPRPLTIPVLANLPAIDWSTAENHDVSDFAAGMSKVHEALGACHKGELHRRLLVLAGEYGEDAAAVAVSLAAIAAASQSVLLIDADTEGRTASSITGDRSMTGLLDAAAGRCNLANAISLDPATNINVVRAVGRFPVDIDIDAAFKLTKHFGMVIVIGIARRLNPSAVTLAQVADHILLVAKADQTDDNAMERLVSDLGKNSGKICGRVLTGGALAA